MPILGMGKFQKILYIDGFAGPGRYSQGEDGSPIIALKTAMNQPLITSDIGFLFVEEHAERASVLIAAVNELNLLSNFTVKIFPEKTFEQAMEELLKAAGAKNKPLPPTFAFIDPFGWSGVPFDAVSSILQNPSCEVLVTFMYEEINRFIGHPDQEENFDSFFGTDAWREVISIPVPRQRNRQLHDLYMNQLRDSAQAKYVRSFEMRNDKDVTDYYLFYATNNILGLKKMKEAMWKVDASGEFRFSDATDPQQSVFFIDEPQFGDLQTQLVARYLGEETTVGGVEEFVVAETAFRETHYKSLLKQMESAWPPELEVIAPPPGRRKGSFSDPSLRLRILPKPSPLL